MFFLNSSAVIHHLYNVEINLTARLYVILPHKLTSSYCFVLSTWFETVSIRFNMKLWYCNRVSSASEMNFPSYNTSIYIDIACHWTICISMFIYIQIDIYFGGQLTMHFNDKWSSFGFCDIAVAVRRRGVHGAAIVMQDALPRRFTNEMTQ